MSNLGSQELGDIILGSEGASFLGANGQTQARLIAFGVNRFGQAQSSIKQIYIVSGQSQAFIIYRSYVTGQSNAYIKALVNSFGQAQSDIKQTYTQSGQSQARIKNIYNSFGQAQGYISRGSSQFGQAHSWIKQTYPLCYQVVSSVQLGNFVLGIDQLATETTTTVCIGGFGQAQATILPDSYKPTGQAQANIKNTYIGSGQAQALTGVLSRGFGQAQGHIKSYPTNFGQSQADIKNTYFVLGQSQAAIKTSYYGSGQSQGFIRGGSQAYGQAQGYLPSSYYLLDTFTRETAFGDIGTPDIGPIWTPAFSDETNDIWSRVHNGKFRFAHSTVEFPSTWMVSPISATDIDYTGEYRVEASVDMGSFELDAKINGFSLTTYVFRASVITNTWTLGTTTGTTSATASFSLTPNTTYRFHFQVENGNARFNIWPATENEPVGWLIQRTGADTSASAVGFALNALSDGGVTYIDNISVLPAYLMRFQTNIAQAQALINVPYRNGQAQAVINVPIKSGQAQAYINPGYKIAQGQSQAVLVAQNLIFLDTFSREIERTAYIIETLGNPDIGKYYNFAAFNPGALSTGDNFVMSGVGTSDDIYLGTIISTQVATITGDFYADIYPSYGLYFLEAANIPYSEWVNLYVDAGSGSPGSFRLEFADTGIASIPFTFVNGTTYRVRISISGTEFKAKIWDLSGVEPDWMISVAQVAFTIATVGWQTQFGPNIQAMDNLNIYSPDRGIVLNSGLAQAFIDNTIRSGQSCAWIKKTGITKSGQARPFIRFNGGRGQARARIKIVGIRSAQAQAAIKTTYYKIGFAQALIDSRVKNIYAQSNALIDSIAKVRSAQAVAKISNTSYYLVDTFTRTGLLDSFPTPDYGPNWINTEGDSTLAILDGENLTLTGTAITYPFIAPSNPINATNVDIYLEATRQSIGDYFEIDARSTIGVGLVWVWVDTLNIWHLVSYNNSTGLQVDVTANYEIVPNRKYSFRLVVKNTKAYFKIWETEYPELVDWLVILSDLTMLGPGAVAISMDIDNAVRTTSIHTINVKYAATVQFGQAGAYIRGPNSVVGQAQSKINAFNTNNYGQAQASIDNTIKHAQASVWVETTNSRYGQARANIELISRKQGQAQVFIKSSPILSGQTQSYIYRPQGYGQSIAYILEHLGTGQAQALIVVKTIIKSGQSLAIIVPPIQGYGQAQAKMNGGAKRSGQARAFIYPTGRAYGQAQALIYKLTTIKYGQTQGRIINIIIIQGLARAVIVKPTKIGQAQAKILAYGQVARGNARAFIRRTDTIYHSGQAMAAVRRSDPVGQAQAVIAGGRYLVRYNGYQLPGYAQVENLSSDMRIEDHDVTYQDNPFAEYVGLQNKVLPVSMRVVGNTYLDVKNQVQNAGTIVRSSKSWVKLYIQRYDRYYTAVTKKISTEKTVGSSMRLLDYTVEFEAKPWLTSDAIYTISGVGLVNTDMVVRDIYSGSWAPIKMIVSGTNITVSGYTESGEFTGFVSISGIVTNMIIDSELYTSTMNGNNSNDKMYTPNYQLFVGPGKTIFDINGASSCTITYRNRWYL